MSTRDIDREMVEALRMLRRAVVSQRVQARRARLVPAGPNMAARMTTGALLGEVTRRGYAVGDPRREVYAREFERRHLPETASFVRQQEDEYHESYGSRGSEVASTVAVTAGAAMLAGVLEERMNDVGLAEQARWDVVEADVENFLEETPGGDDVLDAVEVEPVTMEEMAQDFAFLGLDEELVAAAEFAGGFDEMALPEAIAVPQEKDESLSGFNHDLDEALEQDSENIL
ncbi:hypothetical protein [Corynebacterium oculi]|uniref:Uncharacterized protein n=1 Tax=Corynebacterium oculi TaxID=1544416 RepID=A0A0Q0Z3X8_9CORY|nr:hypothetical protein [Corynebacterium oculi]KQB84064.1 hypothetical protein Cocul_00860 [Corynebacterium oculi]